MRSGDRDQVLHRAIGPDVADLDPQLAATISEGDLAASLFEGLVAEDPVDLRPVPAVAERWEHSPDLLRYTFYLRPSARWSDGSPLSAGDFVASWKRVLAPSFGAANAGLLYVVRGAEAYHKGATTHFAEVGVKAPDAFTLQVTLEHPTPYFLSLLAHPAWFPVPLGTITAAGEAYARGNPWTRPDRMVGNGPFVLKEWQPNRSIVVEKSPTYWDAGTVRLQAIHFYPVDSRDTEERMFRTGQLHVTYALPFAKVDAYRRSKPEVLRIDPYLSSYFFRLNLRDPYLGKEKVRQALALAIDRNAIVEKLLRGGQQAAMAITPPGMPGYNPPVGHASDFAAARDRLAKAGHPNSRGLPPFEVLFNTSDNNRILAEAVQEMWRRELGVEVRLQNQDFKVVLAQRRLGQFQILLSDWVGDYLDPSTFLNLWRSDGANNHTGWSNLEYDTLLFAAARNPDPEARADQLRRAESLLLGEAPVIPLFHHTHVFLLQPSVRGWHANLLDRHPYKHVWLEE